MDTIKKQRIVVGLTGGIASGKSVAAEMLKNAGAYIVDADEISKAVSEKSEVNSLLVAKFPGAAVGGKIDRRKLREIVFASESELRRLESVMHPLIKKEAQAKINESSARITVLVAPLLFEAGFDELTDVTVTVSCSEGERIRRLMERDNISDELARKMISSQLSDCERERSASYTVRNEGSTAQLRAEILRLYSQFDFLTGG